MSFFLEPELKFTRVINGLASAIKASSITHSAKEAPEASISHLLFVSRRVRALQTRWRNAWPSHPAVPGGARLKGGGVPPRSAPGAQPSHFPLIPMLPAASRELFRGASLSQRPSMALAHRRKATSLSLVSGVLQVQASVYLSVTLSHKALPALKPGLYLWVLLTLAGFLSWNALPPPGSPPRSSTY